MTSEREGYLNLIHLQSLLEVDILKVVNMFIRNGNKRLMQNLTSNNFFKHMK